MKHKLSFTVALWWVILCAVAGLFLILVSDKDSRLSESENRMLAAFPEVSAKSLVSGDFMTGFDDFLSDAFFDRDGVVSFTEKLLGRFSMLSQDDLREIQAQIMELLTNLHKKLGISIIFISHDLRVVYRMSDHVLIMKNGRVVEYGKTRDVYKNPQADYTKALLKAAGIT